MPAAPAASPMRAGAMLVAVLLLAGCATPPSPPPPVAPPPQVTPDFSADARRFTGSLDLVHWQTEENFAVVVPGEPHGDGVRPVYRVTGSEGNNATARWIAGFLAAQGLAVGWDNFTAQFEGRPLPAHNVVGTKAGRTSQTLYLGAHYDTRPCADKDPDPAKRGEPVLGANDGASGVAVLLELARLLQPREMNLTLRFVFFDAEDMGDAGLGCGRGTAWAQGSAHYAAALSEEEVQRARGMVLVDLVGDPAAEFRREGRSAVAPHRALQDDLWAWAARLGHGQFINATSQPILDDHVAFQQRGIPSVDIIHLDDDGRDVFPDSHHTTFDDLAHVSPATLEAVGETLLAAVLGWDAAEGAGFK